MATAIQRLLKQLFAKSDNFPVIPEEKIVFSTLLEYYQLIEKYIPYFNTLAKDDKIKFIKRTWYFKQSKRFHFIEMQELPEAAVLVSAAAVQLTFGLRKYRLSYFRDIYILPDAYQYTPGGEHYIGHVSPAGIYISWKHFLQGYADHRDNVNVAIHEMAHALEHSSFLDHQGTDEDFKTDFAKLSPVFGPSLAETFLQKRSYLRPYAYTNMQEFWAVSVETFFENPADLKAYMPALYKVIAEVLNQDSLAEARIITRA
jgi:Mlc titration factor MtfA (ptsG expression regulator)